MKLTELDAKFMRWYKSEADEHHGRTLPDGTTQWGGFEVDTFDYQESIEGAHSVQFLCPKCFTKNNGAVGTHRIFVYFKGSPVPDTINRGVRWEVSGTSLENLTITPSVLCIGGCAWHGFVTNGEVRSV